MVSLVDMEKKWEKRMLKKKRKLYSILCVFTIICALSFFFLISYIENKGVRQVGWSIWCVLGTVSMTICIIPVLFHYVFEKTQIPSLKNLEFDPTIFFTSLSILLTLCIGFIMVITLTH